MDDENFFYVRDHHKRVNIYSFMEQMQISHNDVVTVIDNTVNVHEMVKWCEDIAGEDFVFSTMYNTFWFKDRGIMALFKLTWL